MKREFLEIYLTTFYGVRNFGNTPTMKVIFFWKCSEFNENLRNAEKNWEKVFSFWDTSILIGCIKLPPLRREYLSLAVNVLTNSLKILDNSKRYFFQLNYARNDQ